MRMHAVRCSECKGRFERPAQATNKETCSPECAHKRKVRLQSERRRKQKRADAPTHCAHCGDPLNPSRFTAKYCAKRECQLARKRSNNQAALERYAAVMRSEGKRQCPHCGEWHVRSEMYATCGREKCVATQLRLRKAEQWRRRAELKRIAADEKAQALARQQRESEMWADIDRVVSTAPCYWRGFFDDKSEWVEPVKTNVPGYDWDDPIMGVAWDYGVGVEWVMTYEYWRCAA